MEVVSKLCQDQFLHPILVHSLLEKKENIGSQMGHTKKKDLRKDLLQFLSPVLIVSFDLFEVSSNEREKKHWCNNI